MEKETEVYLAQSGSFQGYEVEYKAPNGKWQVLVMEEGKTLNGQRPRGVPLPLCYSGILHTIGLKGRSQAMTLAWWAKAESEFERLELRVVPCNITFEMKAKRQDDGIIEVV